MKKIKFKGERTRSTLIIVAALIAFLVSICADFRLGYTLLVAVVAPMATYELMHACSVKSPLLYAVACAASAFSAFYVSYDIPLKAVGVFVSFYALTLLFLAVILNKEIKYVDSVVTLFASVAIPYSFTCFIRLNDIAKLSPEKLSHHEGAFLVMLAFSCSWLTDSFAFLVGRKFGKHKMTPVISPKKSFEGAIFGTLITAAVNVLLLFCYSFGTSKLGYHAFFGESAMKYLYIFPISCVLSVVSMFGDLAASVLKRNVGIKDYSNLLPGHGGI
ncbi:MAG: phosphatidate cytidylyltransferase, partial [Clostridia bacterium]|nr:phosphatidate cytidylyltransferase [Clostridia bacterium]